MASQWISMMMVIVLMNSNSVFTQNKNQIEYQGKTPEGLVGNGRSVVKVRANGFEFHTGGNAVGTFRLIVRGKPCEFDSGFTGATFFPGGVVYTARCAGMTMEILHGATSEIPYIAVVRVKNAKGKVELEVQSKGEPVINPAGRIRFSLKNGSGEAIIAAGATFPRKSLDEFRKQFEAPYQQGFLLETPSPLIDRAVPFNRYLLDLGFDGKLHVCEIFRWRDVWSRDLGTGLAPGAMVSGEFAAARTTMEYDLHRYAINDPRGLKVTEDPSQGGSAEGTAWLTQAVWRYYLLTGDKEFLANAARILLPWIDAWIARDANEEGLLIDVTEWMDHSRFFLFPDGSRVLYSNVLFAELLGTFSKIEQSLGDSAESQKLDGIRDRFVRGINSVLWNESTGEYDNLSLWGRRDTRSSSAENALAILCGVAPATRIHRILAAVKENNWRKTGSTTIFPPMTHVDISVDHNYKVWPWWNAVEAKARFLNGDIDGGIHLLERCSATLEDEHYPGLMEELVSPDGVTEGGNAFLSAAGSYQDAIFEGLLGIEILEPGCERIRVSPHTPGNWKNWRSNIPLPRGEIILTQTEGKLQIRVTDARVKIVEAPESAVVEGARHAAIGARSSGVTNDTSAPKTIKAPAPRVRRSAVFFDKNIPSDSVNVLSRRRISTEELIHIDTTDIEALIIAGNSLPRKTREGTDVRPALARFLDRGGAIVFYGATMQERGTTGAMGEYGGLINWYEYRAGIHTRPITGWKFQASQDGITIKREHERGMMRGWNKSEISDTGWHDIRVPSLWEEHLGSQYDGWGWYRTHFTLPEDARGKTITLNLGRIDDEDWTFVNGIEIGAQKGWQTYRRYFLRPGDSAYARLNFGDDNVLAIQVYDGGGGGGLFADSTTLGIEMGHRAWMPIDPRNGMTLDHPIRLGVVSWGPGGNFFNSWETSRGAFGFKVDGRGAEFTGPLSDFPRLNVAVHEAFTDFAVSKPWLFQPLAFTETHRNLLYPDDGERYPCMARLVNTQTGGEFVLVPASISVTNVGLEVLRKLRIDLGDQPR